MGGAVKAVTEVVSSVGSAVGGVTQAFGGLTQALGPIGSILGSPYLTAASLAFQAYSATQARKSQREASGYERQRVEQATRLEESRRRQSEVEARQRRLAAVREQRIRTGQVLASTGGAGLGIAGTSGVIGSVGALSSQAAANIGNINVAQSFAAEQSGYSVGAGVAASKSAQATAQAGGWQQMGTLAQGFSSQMGNIFKSPDIT